jgi:hypothetical protein
MKKFTMVAAGLLACLAMTAQAGLIGFDEGADPQVGTFSYDGLGGGAVGSGINFSTIDGVDTPANAGSVLECRGCLLEFITGANTLEGPAIWQWLAGGSFAVTGDAYDGATLVASGALLTGSFSAGSFSLGNGVNGGNQLFVGVGTDAKHEGIVDYFGYDPGTAFSFATTNLSLLGCTNSGGSGGFNCNVSNADLDNAANVPLPATAFLMAIGAAGLVTARKKAKT